MAANQFSDQTYLLNFLCAIFIGLTAWFYIRCMADDPGFVPKMNGIAEQKAVIDDLIATWKFDESNFCVTCMIRTPLRSKHCRRCQRCVAKHDQYVLRTGCRRSGLTRRQSLSLGVQLRRCQQPPPLLPVPHQSRLFRHHF